MIGEIISGVAQVGGQALANRAAKKQQQRQMEWNEKFWNMQNEYNSPQAQMKRLQEAGLNPHLVYGQSSGSAAGQAGLMTAPDIDPAGIRPIDPQGLMQVLGSYYDFDVKQAQSDKLKAETQVKQEEAILKAQESYGAGVRNAKSLFDLNLAEELRNTSLEAAKEQLRKLKADTQFTLRSDERAELINASNLQEAAERIMSSRLGRVLTREQIATIRQDREIRQLDLRLSQMGLRPSDPLYMRLVSQMLKNLGKQFGIDLSIE